MPTPPPPPVEGESSGTPRIIGRTSIHCGATDPLLEHVERSAKEACALHRKNVGAKLTFPKSVAQA